METWLQDAKKLASDEANEIIDNLRFLATRHNLDEEWFIEEVVKHINRLTTQHND